MAEFSISMWFSVEADSWEEAYGAVTTIGKIVENSEEIICTDSGEIAVETEEDVE